MSHPNACKERLTIDRKLGGRGIIDVQSLHATQIQTLRHFFHTKQTNLHRAIVKAYKNYTPLNLSSPDHKALHGKHRYRVTQDHINKKQSYIWLQDGQLFPETEGFMLAIQDQVIATRNCKKYIIKDPSITDVSCRRTIFSEENKKRKESIREFIKTEKAYVKDLETVHEVFEMPLRKSKIISNEDIDTIFLNWQEITHCNKSFLEAFLKAYNTSETIGDVISEHKAALTDRSGVKRVSLFLLLGNFEGSIMAG
ncbi:unnamed protein product [Callosobruchus maculatus]|uniref:DH domain-containing protein n=1 Tax=Callosobruchus maculatus TaxID=64391 RepID=A0A653DD80_CALMS|nr:unnamed protein product [Callosobruchus maculatus]